MSRLPDVLDAPAVGHASVLLAPAVQALVANQPPTSLAHQVFVDATVGGGGHTLALSQALPPSARLIGLDQDPEAIERARSVLADAHPPVTLVTGNFGQLGAHLDALGVEYITGGILLDLGYSAFQIRSQTRGFSFQTDAPLDMRMSPTQPRTAADILNTWPEADLVALFKTMADERLARPIARVIGRQRAVAPIESTTELAKLVSKVYAQKGLGDKQRIHPATRVFQALRMAVNDEIPMLKTCLEHLNDRLAPGARAAIITFHSVEDRVVKQHFRHYSAPCLCPPGLPVCQCQAQPLYHKPQKPIVPGPDEIEANVQARSAKLRVAVKR
ncbi:MAG: 16S rRNA (cytosine(1402)-N(4))-methyltransferase RsmH [Cyanobacteria bacterium HKST-UBA06]|nr:16S rRNA (cytosine(1402)-N(4))-methyltransferase RsmH [Cyanobacteria bacterium HKST-UBA06]